MHSLLLFAAVAQAAYVEIDDGGLISLLQMEMKRVGNDKKASANTHPWPHFRGAIPGQAGVSDTVAPGNLSASLAWSWHHPEGQYHTLLAGGPVIDSKKNVYVTGADGIRKFSPEGDELWKYKPPGVSNNAPMLMDDKVYGSDKSGYAFAVDMETGKAMWEQRLASENGGDSGYPAGFDGVFVVGAEKGHDPVSDGGNKKILGLDAASGEKLWDFEVATPVWNFAPLFPGDDTVVFMDFGGGVYRLGLHNGTLLWHVPDAKCHGCFSDGGASLGPNEAVYTCSNSGTQHGQEGTQGVVRGFKLQDGALLWEQVLPQPCNSYPAIGHVHGYSGLAVVVLPGSFMGQPNLHGGVMALDAESGELLWQYQNEPWHGPQAKGDIEGALERAAVGVQTICLPAHWSAATISADGVVFGARSDGRLYAVRGPANTAPLGQDPASLPVDFATTPGVEAEIFDAGGASLHGATAWAPGQLAVGTCDSLFVFKF
eukprot:gb/GFBE01004936.1/.p1 GENE.gb/GFBE01004936.1/~~gb/GFBE01004936.1/.p1  ORF type:complete len:485 (+),score=108.58 gb/GFBE01004936.1/:1-1455(+)